MVETWRGRFCMPDIQGSFPVPCVRVTALPPPFHWQLAWQYILQYPRRSRNVGWTDSQFCQLHGSTAFSDRLFSDPPPQRVTLPRGEWGGGHALEGLCVYRTGGVCPPFQVDNQPFQSLLSALQPPDVTFPSVLLVQPLRAASATTHAPPPPRF